MMMMMMMNIKSSPTTNSVEILSICEDFCMEFYTAVKHSHILITARFRLNLSDKLISYRRDTTLQGALVLAKSGRLELGDNILRTLLVTCYV